MLMHERSDRRETGRTPQLPDGWDGTACIWRMQRERGAMPRQSAQMVVRIPCFWWFRGSRNVRLTILNSKEQEICS